MAAQFNICKSNIHAIIQIKRNALAEPTETAFQLMLLSSTPVLSTNYYWQNLKMFPVEPFSSSENTIPTNTLCARNNE